MRIRLAIAAIVLASSGAALAQSNYYGPWRGSPPAGYKEVAGADGYWKIDAGSTGRGGVIAIDVAIYRAAELAQAAGHKFVEVHNAFTREDRSGNQEATLYARGSDAPVKPARCRKGKSPRACYTASVAEVFRQLGGASGREKAVAVPQRDKYGRTVLQSGFGIGAVGQ